MITSAFVKIWNQRVGAVAWDSITRECAFEFDSEFLKSNLDLAPLQMPIHSANRRIFSFPKLKNSNTFKGLPGLLSDTLPDKYGNSLINIWLSKQGRESDSLNPIEMLCFIGKRGMGALEFEPTIPKANEKSTSIEISSLVGIAEEILNGRKNFNTKLSENEEKGLYDMLKIGTSAGGARAKAVIAYNTKTKEIRSGQADAPKGFSQWLIKFDGVTDNQFGASSGYGRVEMAYYLMAKDAGIEMMECELLEENDRAHFMTRRFDRLPNNEKLHVQTFCAMRHFDFNEVNLFSYEQLFETMRMLGLPYLQAEQLFRRMAFNVMSRNCDDHTKNFAFVLNASGGWSLSPAYDICHAYRPGSTWVSQHALSMNGKRKDIEKEDLMKVAKAMNIKKADKIVSQISDVVSRWDEYANRVGVEKKLQMAIQRTLILL
jgi:serine/threonine-protein kinase HipA